MVVQKREIVLDVAELVTVPSVPVEAAETVTEAVLVPAVVPLVSLTLTVTLYVFADGNMCAIVFVVVVCAPEPSPKFHR
jgi:hypothetical protein